MLKKALIILAIALSPAPAKLWAIIYTWTGPDGGSWTEASNWNRGAVPGVNDSAKISGSTVIVPDGEEDFNLAGLFLREQGTLDIRKTGDIAIRGLLSLSGTIKSRGNTYFQDKIYLNGNLTLEFSGQEVSEVSFKSIVGSNFNLHIDCKGERAKPLFNAGIKVSNLTITTNTSSPWICPAVNTPTGSLIINSKSMVSLGSGDGKNINVGRLLLRGSSAYNFDRSGNSIRNIALDASGIINLKTNENVTIASINTFDTPPETVNGINSTNISLIAENCNISQNLAAPIITSNFSIFKALNEGGEPHGNITLNSEGNSFKSLTLSGNNVEVRQNNNNLNLGAIHVVNLVLEAGGSINILEEIGTTARPISNITFDTAGNITTTFPISLSRNLIINGETLNTNKNIDVGNSITGTGTLQATGTPSINIGGDFKIANFIAGNSTVTLDGNTAAFLGSGSEFSLFNLTINKYANQSYGRVSAESEIQVNGDLNINNGTLNAGSQTIEVTGNMNIKASGVFGAGTGTVRFIESDSILESTGETFNHLEVIDSNLSIQNGDLRVNGNAKVVSNDNPAKLKFVRGAHAATISNLLLDGTSSPVVDFVNWDFSIYDSFDNKDGEVRLTGEQTNQSFAYDSVHKNKMGLVSYYGEGAIRHEDFWNLKIDAAGQSVRLDSGISIHGYYDPNSNKTLSTPVSETDLIGFQLLNGTLNTANHTIRLYGSYIREDAATIAGNLKLTLLGNYPAYIGGNNNFSEFICEDASVQGKIIYFQSGKTTTVGNNARFAIRGRGIYPPGQLNPNSLVFPSQRSYVYVVSSQPSRTTHYWNFSRLPLAELELEFAYLLHSDATANPQIKLVNVTFQDCPNWHSSPYISLSKTKDIGEGETAVHNGRIDKILVNTYLELNMNFDDFEVEVEGYKVRGFKEFEGDATRFYILLEEQSYLDTSTTPRWKIVRNNSLRLKNEIAGSELRLYDGAEDASNAKAYETPYDDASPIIGYTLAIADKKEIFVHFSEPVVKADSSSITGSDFITSAGSGVGSLERVSDEAHGGMRELILKTNGNISAEDILNGVELSVNSGIRDIQSPRSTHNFDVSSADPDDVTDSLQRESHRISDVGLGIVGNGLVEPITARSSSNINSVGGSGLGVISDFDWSGFLPADDFSIMAHRYTGISAEPLLIYSGNASAEVKNGKLWLPSFGEDASMKRNFSGLVPAPNMQTARKSAISSSGDNYTYQFNMPDAMIENGRDLEFVFYFEGQKLCCAQVRDDTASNWYRQVIPWAIKIRDIAAQSGTVSILNNIVNPNNNEKTSMYYELKKSGVVTIQVFDLSGDTVAVLQRGFQSAGKYSVSWDGRNGAGNPVARGIYFVRFVGPGKMDQIRKVLVIK